MPACSASLRLCIVLSALLLAAGVEPNPGPTKLDDVLLELRAMRDELNTKLTQLSIDLTDRIEANSSSIQMINNRLAAAERNISDLTIKMDDLARLYSAGVSSTSTTGDATSITPVVSTVSHRA